MLLLSTLLMATSLFSATVTWTNGGGDGLWSNAANWSGSTVPGAADDVVFDATSAATCTVDIAATVASITFNTTGVVAFNNDLVVTGNVTIAAVNRLQSNSGNWALQVSGDVTIDDPSYWYTQSSNTTDIKLVAGADQTISGTGSIHDLDVQKTGGSVLMPDDLNLTNGKLTGNGTQLLKNTGGIAVVSAGYNFDFAGQVDDLEFNSTNSFATLSQDLTVNNDVTITAIQSIRNFALVVSGNVITNDPSYWYTQSSNTTDIKLVAGADQTISGTGKIHDLDVVKPAGLVIMNTALIRSSFALVTVSSGVWDVNNYTITSSGGFTTNGGNIGGSGTLNGNVTCNTGGIAPGVSPGCVTVNGNVTFNSGSTFDVEIGGNTPCTLHDQLIVNGTVTINGAALTGTTTASASTITIIDNDGNDAIGGTKFAGAPEGATITIGGTDYIISYIGGDGNDVTLSGNQPPVAVCQNVTVSADANCEDIATVAADFDGGSTDPDGDPLTFSVSPATPYPLGTTAVVLTVSDDKGASSTCSATITVQDNTAPAIICKPFTVNLGSTGGPATIQPFNVYDSGTDNCSSVSLVSVSPNTFDCSNIGPNTVTLTATDNNGNNGTCTATVTINDNIAPAITCPANISASNDAGVCGAVVNYSAATATDNCSATVTYSQNSGTAFPVGTTTVTATATDPGNNTAICSFDVTVNDNEAPSITCAAAQTQTADPSVCEAAVTVAQPTFSDNCSANFTPELSSISNTNTLTIEAWVKPNGQQNPATGIVFNRTSPNGATGLNFAYNNATPNTQIGYHWTDNAGTWNWSGGPTYVLNEWNHIALVIEPNKATIYVTNSNGTSSAVNAITHIPVDLNSLWNIGDDTCCPGREFNGTIDEVRIWNKSRSQAEIMATMNTELAGNETDLVLYYNFNQGVAGGNNAGITSLYDLVGSVNGTLQNFGLTGATSNWVAGQTGFGNALEMDGINDRIPFNNMVPVNTLTIENDYNNTANASGTYPVGNTTVTWTATDEAGNTNTCSQTITVTDDETPSISCPANISASNTLGTCTAVVTYTAPVGTDNCSATTTQTAGLGSGATFPVGTTTETYGVTDGSGNTASCSFTVTVTDDTAPSINCAAAQAQTADPGVCEAAVTVVAPTVSDNCDTPVNFGSALAFDGTEYVQLPSAANVQSVTMWVKLTGPWYIIDARNGLTNGYLYHNGIGPGWTKMYVNGVQVPVQYGNIPTNQWVHLYLEASGTFTDDINLMSRFSNNEFGAGEMDEVGLWDRTFTEVQIQALMSSPIAPGSANLQAYYSFEEPAGSTTLTDETGNGHDGTLVNHEPNDWIPSGVPMGSITSVTLVNDYNNTSDASGIYPVGPATVTWTATDDAGNTNTCTQTITVTDDEAPAITCPAAISAIATSSAGAAVTYTAPVGSDNCTGATTAQTAGLASGSTFPIGTTTNTFTVTDAAGNSTSCSFDVTVTGVPPSIVCPANMTVNTDPNVCEAAVSYAATETTGIPASTITYDINPGSTFVLGTTTVTATATNAVGTDQCSFTVTVVDNEAPNAICQAVTVQLDNSGNGSTAAAAVDNGSNDACGIASLSLAPSAFTCADVGTNLVTLTATDNNGNTNSCTATVTVEDNVAPVATCQDVTVQLDANGAGSITTGDIDNGSSDACGINSLSLDITGFDCSDVASVGGAGATNQYALDFDGSNDRVELGNGILTGGSYTKEAWVYARNAACRNILSAANKHQFWLFNKLYGGHGTQFSLVMDNQNFPLNSWEHVAVTYNASTNTMILYRDGVQVDINTNVPGYSDGGFFSISGHGNTGCNWDGMIDEVRLWNHARTQSEIQSAMNSILSGSESGLIAYYNFEDGPGSTTLSDVTGNGHTGTLITMDPANDWVSSGVPVSGGSTGNTVTLTVTDNNGNSSNCTATVTVEDNVAPVATCQDVTVQLDASGSGGINTGDINNGSSDACGINSLALDNTAFNCSDVGSANTVTLTVTDNNGNSSNCTATVTVEDNVAPVATCQDVTVQLDASGSGGITAAAVDNGSSDACGIANLALDNAAFGCNDVGSANTVTLTVTDNNGNSSNCTATVTVEDNVAPIAICKPATVQLDANGDGSLATASAVDDGSSDACGIFFMTVAPGVFGCADVGPNSVTLTVTDNNGNSSNCTATVTVEDNVAPVATCQDVTVQLDANGNGTTSAAAVDNTSSDACGIATLTLDNTAFSCAEVGSANTVTLTVTDVNGNSSTCTATVTVEDNVAPIALCQPVTIQLDGSGNGSTTATAVDNGSNDACGIASIVLDNTAFTCSDVGPNTVILTVTDVNGNSSTCTATVTVEDNTAPVISGCPSNAEYCGEQAVIWTAPSASDNCLVSFTSSHLPGATFSVGTTTVTYTALDAGGNTATCSFDIIVHALPDLDISQSDVPAFCQGLAVLTANVANEPDLLLPLGYSWSAGLGNDASVLIQSNNTYTVTVTDDRGCSSTESASVNVTASNVLSGYVLIADEEIKLEDHSTVSGGGVGVMDSDGEIEVEDDSEISTFARADEIDVDNSSTVAQEINSPANVTLPPFKGNPNPGSNNIKVQEGQTVTLTGSSYGKVEVKKNGTLIFDAPEVYVKELKVKKNAVVDFDQTAEIIVDKDIKLDKNSLVNAAMETVVFYTEKKLNVKEGSTFFGNVYAKKEIKAKGKSNNHTSMTGQFISLDEIESEKYVDWNWADDCGLNLLPPAQLVAPPVVDAGAAAISSKGLEVFPNPASSNAVIDLEGMDGAVELSIYNQFGRKVWYWKLGERERSATINLSGPNFVDGIYFVHAVSEDQRLVQRLVIAK